MWLIFAALTFLAWGFADLFYKLGNDNEEKCSHIKTGIMVGLVMGITGLATLIIKGIPYDFRNLLIYLPVSAMYILSMVVGYFGLRYLELSVSSPVQNASGAVSSILLIIVLHELPDLISGIAVILITIGVVMLGVFERKKEKIPLSKEQKKYSKGIAAILIPIFYCIIDSIGTFLDGYYLDDISTTPLLGVTEETLEDTANISYELTFLFVAIVFIVYLLVFKHEKISLKGRGKHRLFASLFETAGQFAYVYAMSGNGIVAAPVVGAYCVASVVFARIFLKEKLSLGEYLMIGLVFIGIIMLGVVEGLAE